MTTRAEYSAALSSLPREAFNSRMWKLLAAVEAAWAGADGGIPSEQEARRWSPVCDAAVFAVGFEIGRREA